MTETAVFGTQELRLAHQLPQHSDSDFTVNHFIIISNPKYLSRPSLASANNILPPLLPSIENQRKESPGLTQHMWVVF